MTVALITHPACLQHDTGDWHPECPDRLRSVLQALEAQQFSNLVRQTAPQATVEQLARVHPERYIEQILSIRPNPPHLVQLDPDTVMSAGSAEAALRAAGGAAFAVDCVMEGWARAAFAAIRPPGHHAEPARAMGFCLFNNAAVAAMQARIQWRLSRVAVLDFDVHHGNGTQAIFQRDAGLFYGSTHQHPCYPGTGLPSERGVAGNIVNVGLPAGTGTAGFRAAWADKIIPELRAFAPELVIISAGFDAHRADPLAELRLEVADYTWITQELMAVADETAGGRIVSMLEGGYDLDALAVCAAAHVAALMRH